MQDVNGKLFSILTNLQNNCHLKHLYCLLNAYDPTIEVDKCRKVSHTFLISYKINIVHIRNGTTSARKADLYQVTYVNLSISSL